MNDENLNKEEYNSDYFEKQQKKAVNLSSERKKATRYLINFIYLFIFLCVFGFIWAVYDKYNDLASDAKKAQFAKQQDREKILDDSNFDNFSIYSSQIDSQIQKLNKNQEELKQNIDSLVVNTKKSISEFGKQINSFQSRQANNNTKFQQEIKDNINNIQQSFSELKQKQNDIYENFNSKLKDQDKKINELSKTNPNSSNYPNNQGSNNTLKKGGEQIATGENKIYNEEWSINVIDINGGEDINEDNNEYKPNNLQINAGVAQGVVISAGSATVIGMGRQEDLPVAVKITSDMINANDSKTQMKGCVVYGTGTGSMVDERVNVRLSKISCVFNGEDGQEWVAESQVKGYLSDENGGAGLSGTLITKEGKILQATLPLALYQSGLDYISKLGSTTIVGLGTGTSTALSSLGTGVNSSGSTTISRITNIYEKYLQAMNPVVNVKAGREVTVNFSGGENIALKVKHYSPVETKKDRNVNRNLIMNDSGYDYDFYETGIRGEW